MELESFFKFNNVINDKPPKSMKEPHFPYFKFLNSQLHFSFDMFFDLKNKNKNKAVSCLQK